MVTGSGLQPPAWRCGCYLDRSGEKGDQHRASRLRAEEGDEEGERTSSDPSEGAGLDFELEDEADDEKDATSTDRAAADHPGWASLNTAESGPGRPGPAVAGDTDTLDAAKIRRLSAYLGDSLTLGRALSTPIADPPQLTVLQSRHMRPACCRVGRCCVDC